MVLSLVNVLFMLNLYCYYIICDTMAVGVDVCDSSVIALLFDTFVDDGVENVVLLLILLLLNCYCIAVLLYSL